MYTGLPVTKELLATACYCGWWYSQTCASISKQ